MQALLGKIIEVAGDGAKHRITFEPLCTLPDRKAPPEHLKGAKLTIEREVADPREIGERGDSIALTVREAKPFLQPLAVSTIRGRALITLRLRWCPGDSPPDWVVRAGGKIRSGKWRENPSFHASLQATDFGWQSHETLEIEATCGDFKMRAFVTPAQEIFATKIYTARGAAWRLKNAWLSADVTPRSGGALEDLRRNHGGLGYFQNNDHLIHHPLDWGGHVDRFRSGWGEWNTMRDKTLETGGAAREGASSRVALEGDIEDDLRTQFSATLLDDWPLLLLRRDFFLHAKKDEKKDEKDELKQPIDAMRLFQTGFRCAVRPDQIASRAWCRADGDVMMFSLAQQNEGANFWHWTMEDGFALYEQAARRQWLLYFFDAASRPHLGLWRGPHAATLEPFWPGVPLKPGDSTGFSLGLAAGELGGASESGAWVACRAKQGDEWRCALLGRFKNVPREAVFRLGDNEIKAPLGALLLPGLGTIYAATAPLPEGEAHYELWAGVTEGDTEGDS